MHTISTIEQAYGVLRSNTTIGQNDNMDISQHHPTDTDFNATSPLATALVSASQTSNDQHTISVGEDTIALLEQSTRALDESTAEIMGNLSGPALRDAEASQEAAEQFLKGDNTAARQAVMNASPEIRNAINAAVDRTEQTSSLLQRGQLLLECIGTVLRNDPVPGQSSANRWVGNIAASTVRTGLIVGITTTLRQLVGFALEKAYQQPELVVLNREAAGIAALLVGPGLNLAGFAYDEYRGTATWNTRMARIALFCLAGAGLAASLTTHTTANMASTGVQTLFYTFSRDLLQLFFPTHDNASINLPGTMGAAAAFGLTQLASGFAMDYFAPQSGAGYVSSFATEHRNGIQEQETTTLLTSLIEGIFNNSTSVPDNGQSVAGMYVQTALAALQPYLLHDIFRGIINAVPEVLDDLLGGAIRHYSGTYRQAAHRSATEQGDREERESLAQHEREGNASVQAGSISIPRQNDGFRYGLSRPRIGAGNGPTTDQVARQFLTTNAARTTLMESALAGVIAVAGSLSATQYTATEQQSIINGTVAAVIMLGYIPFLYAHDTRDLSSGQATNRTPSSTELSEVTVHTSTADSVLRQRRGSSSV